MHRQTQLDRRLTILPEDHTLMLLALLEALNHEHLPAGPRRHRLAAQWLCGRFATVEDFLDAAKEGRSGSAGTVRRRAGKPPWRERFVRTARRRYRTGTRIAHYRSGNPHQACPTILLLNDEIPQPQRWTAVFNSRKGKRFKADASWLEAIRTILSEPELTDTGWIASSGTLSYELIAAHARAAGAALLMVESDPGPDGRAAEPGSGTRPPHPEDIFLGCHLGGPRCAKKTRMACRDRLLTQLSDQHVAIEIRPGGTLLRLLTEEQTRVPRPLWIFDSPAGPGQAGGNQLLRNRFRERSRSFSLSRAHSPPGPEPIIASAPPSILSLDQIRPQAYLYHYTRACPGPWPGQSRADYHLALLAHAQGCEHSAFDTLCRILQEQLLRAASKMVRGESAVLCWSARTPADLAILRKWRPGLVRWTVEPYGIAVKRKVLRKMGARPAIYIAAHQYQRLKVEDRYRYQRHEPPGCDWKPEREWRLAGDLPLKQLKRGDALVMVADRAAGRRLASRVSVDFPIVRITEEED